MFVAAQKAPIGQLGAFGVLAGGSEFFSCDSWLVVERDLAKVFGQLSLDLGTVYSSTKQHPCCLAPGAGRWVDVNLSENGGVLL